MIGLEQVGPAIAVLGLLVATLLFLKSRGVARWSAFHVSTVRAPRRMESVERMPLTAQHSLHIVRVGEKLLVIGVSPSGCQVLTECPEASVGTRQGATG